MYVTLYGGLCPGRSEVPGPLGAGVTSAWEPPNVGAGNQTPILAEQYVFSCTDPSLQSQRFLLIAFICRHKGLSFKERQ